MTKDEAIARLKEGAPFSAIYVKEWEDALQMAIKALSVRWHAYPDEKPPEPGDYLVSQYSCLTKKITFVWVEEWDGEDWIDEDFEDSHPLVLDKWVYAWMELPEPMPKEETDG